MTALLAPDEPPAFRIERAEGKSPFFLTCDHASSRIPRKLGTLGLTEVQLGRHIAWDIGAAAVAVKLAAPSVQAATAATNNVRNMEHSLKKQAPAFTVSGPAGRPFDWEITLS